MCWFCKRNLHCREWVCWLIWYVYIWLYKKLPPCLPKWLPVCILPAWMRASVAVVTLCGGNICFPEEKWCWAFPFPYAYLPPLYVFFAEVSMQISCPYFKNRVLLSFKSSVYYFEYNSFVRCILQTFSPNLTYLFILLIASVKEQKFLIFIKSSLFFLRNCAFYAVA